MNELVQDVWQDLRTKRLWPLAVVLLLAIVAIPTLLTKSAAQPPSVEPVATAPVLDDRVTVTLDDGDAASSSAGSSLDEFAEGDPFSPPGAIARSAGGATSSTAAAPTDDAGGQGGGVDGGDDGSSPPFSPPGVPIDVEPAPRTRTETAEYEYVADVSFWVGDRRRKIGGLRKLDMLPNQSAPVLIFMGTTGEGGNAVFLVDSTLRAVGEGRCVPSPANCVYVHLGPGSEHAFTTVEGESYRLRVEEIRRVEVRDASGAGRPSARTSSGDRPAVRRFQLPSLADLVAVTETETVRGPAPASENRSSVPTGGR